MKLVLKADRLIDGTGSELLVNAALVIEGKKITDITSQDKLDFHPNEEITVIDSENSTIMPGFVEAHAHMHCSAEPNAYDQVTTETDEVLLMRAVEAMRSSLHSGVTTIRDLGSKNQIAFPIRKAIEDGIIKGPRLLVAGTPITTTSGHCNMFGTEADTSDEVIKAIRAQVRRGADCIKIMSTGGRFTPRSNIRAPQYPVETLIKAVKDAERLEVQVSAHCHGAAGVRNCVEAGIHNLIHCSWISEDPSKLYDYDPNVADQIAEKGLYVDPTLATGYMRQFRDTDIKIDYEAANQRYEILRDMWDRGVTFVSGLDTGMAHVRFGDFAYTPQLMVEKLDISPADTIVTCTKTTAECLGVIKETGTLEKDKYADVVVVPGNPLEDITVMHLVESIIKQGEIIKRNVLFID